MDENKQNEIRKEDLIFGLDIGASKINLFMGAVTENSVRVLECGDLPLTNSDEMDSVIENLQKAARQLESLASVDVHDVYVGIAGKHVSSLHYKGLITLPTGEVRSQDIENVKNQASTIPESAGQIIHVFPGEYTLDDQAGIRNPKGLNGRRLGVDVQVVTSRPNAIQNLDKCVKSAGLHVMDFVLEPLAAAYAVLTDDERELGVALVDIGAGSADIAVFVGESVRYTASLDLAGNSITSDISKCLKVPISLSKAEEIKKKYGTCKISNLIEDETFPVPGVGRRDWRRDGLCRDVPDSGALWLHFLPGLRNCPQFFDAVRQVHGRGLDDFAFLELPGPCLRVYGPFPDYGAAAAVPELWRYEPDILRTVYRNPVEHFKVGDRQEDCRTLYERVRGFACACL